MKVYKGNTFYFGLSCEQYGVYNSTTGELTNLIGTWFKNKLFYIPTHSGGTLPGTSSVNISSNLNYWIDRTSEPLLGGVSFSTTTIPSDPGQAERIRQALPLAEVIDTGRIEEGYFKLFDPGNSNRYIVFSASTCDYWENGIRVGSRPPQGWPFWNNFVDGGKRASNGFPLATSYNIETGKISGLRWCNVWVYGSNVFTNSFTDNAFAAWLNNVTDYTPDPTDPYTTGGDSGTGGGTGNFDGTSEDINIPNLPTLSAVDTGFISLFNPTAGELKNLANYLWSDVFDISTWKKIFADPMDAILGLSIVPVNVPSSGSATVTIGNISTGVSMTKASSQYVSVDCGTINVNEYWGAYLDYSPYTQAEIYLPFIGIHPLTIDDIMGKPVHVVYHIDVLSGACCAYVKCGGSVLYSFVGQCSCSIPITANDWTNVINGALSIAGAIGSMVASGGATAPMAVSSMASTAVNSLKPNVEKSGSMGGMGGMLGVQKPYIILTRPKQALPAKQNMFTGYPSYITKKLSDCSGYTEVESIHLENVPATDNELSEITNLLKSGVII